MYNDLLTKGYVRVPNVLLGAMLTRLRETTDAMLNAQDPASQEKHRSQGSMLRANENPLFAELITLPAALDVLRGLGFADPTYSDGYIISKPGHSPRLFWHYDWFSWQDPRSYDALPQQLFLMYYLTNTTRENGCLRVIPGSHIHHNPLHDLLNEPHSARLASATDTDLPEFSDRPDEADVPVKAGDLVIGDARLLHAAHANQTDERRTLITLWYQPDLQSLPERMQAQMVRKTQPLPEDWDAASRDLLMPLLASTRYQGDALPYERTLYRKRPE